MQSAVVQVMTVFVNGGSCDGFISKELALGLEVRMFLGNVVNHGEDVSKSTRLLL